MFTSGGCQPQRTKILILETIFMPFILWLANVTITAFVPKVFQDAIYLACSKFHGFYSLGKSQEIFFWFFLRWRTNMQATSCGKNRYIGFY